MRGLQKLTRYWGSDKSGIRISYFPATHYAASNERLNRAMKGIEKRTTNAVKNSKIMISFLKRNAFVCAQSMI
ncbi:MAG: hypothetical protein CM15mP49_02310 [Actinomycetota bacterium]|nr:MAG: hypothetical protein CM15mP49_02310 [Actinomycetota bacterium]